MRNTMIATVSALALMASGAVSATETKSDLKTGTEVQVEAGSDVNTGATVEGVVEGAASIAEGSETGPGDDEEEGGETAGFQSYTDSGAGFSGQVAGGYSAEQLIGSEVIGPGGEKVAEINDLLIGPDDTVDAVLVDVGGFLGLGEKQVALRIEQLMQEQGAGGQFQVNLTKEELEAMPAYVRAEQGLWIEQIVK